MADPTTDDLLQGDTIPKIAIFSHFSTTGACEELRDWLLRRHAPRVVYVAFPFSRSAARCVQVERHENGSVRIRKSLVRFKRPEPLSYLKDVFYAVLYGFRDARGAEIAVAGDNLLTLAFLVLRRLGIVRRVVYYMIDYTPVRFRNSLLNALYLALDRVAAYGADQVWPLSERMISARFEAGRIDPSRVTWRVVPYGNHPVELPATAPVDRHCLVYLGAVLRDKGSSLFVPVLRQLCQHGDYRFVLLGDGDDADTLRDEIRHAGLADRFTLHGYVEDIRDAARILAGCGVAVAPYDPAASRGFTFYADPGKLKLYLGAGLPIVLTAVPPIAARIEREGAGLVAEYDPADLAAKIRRIADSPDYPEYRRKAAILGATYDWNRIFPAALAPLLGHSYPQSIGVASRRPP
jgi:glycosyltransferase involved in cell wall biosynthesis